MHNPIVHTSRAGVRPVAAQWELPELRPVRNIRRPQVAKHAWRLTCTPEELASADAKRV
jgi:hypothetical protein